MESTIDEESDGPSAVEAGSPVDVNHPLLGESLNLTSVDQVPTQAVKVQAEVGQRDSSPGTDSMRRRIQADFQRHTSLCDVIEATHRRLGDAFAEIQTALDSSTGVGADETPLHAPWRLVESSDSASGQTEAMAKLRSEQRLLVFGGPSSGKSSLINRLLGEDVMPIGIGSSLMCQAGLTHLHYSDRPFVRFAGAAAQPLVELDGSRPLAGQIRSFLLNDSYEAQRQAWAEMNGCTLEIGARIELMRCRLAFVEVPSDCVDHLVRERLLRELARSTHHTVVYVVDSQKGFCNQDREFLLFLRANRPEDPVIFAVNKVDYDPEAELMDGNTDDEESEDGEEQDDGSSVHETGEATQSRKLRLVNEQLTRYRLVHAGSGQGGRVRSVFPLSLLRLRVPLTLGSASSKSLVLRLNEQYRRQYHELEEALCNYLLLTSSAGVDGATCALYLKASLAFDAFARDPAREEADSRAAPVKETIRLAISEARQTIEELKRKLRTELTRLHQEREATIVTECGQLEFGPLRLHNRIRNNEVEQQYRTQLHNYVLHLLNSEVSVGLDDDLKQLRADLTVIIGQLQSRLMKGSSEHSLDGGFVDSQWNSVVRMQAQEAQSIAAKMHRLSVEWEGDFKFFTWMRRLVTASRGQASGQAATFNSFEWKATVAKNFYEDINLSAVVKKFFSNLEAKLQQTERRLQCLAASRQRCGTRLRRLLRRADPAASAAWRSAQRCQATADALRNAQRFGLINLGRQVGSGRLGFQYALSAQGYAGFFHGQHSATVLSTEGPIGSVCSLYLGQRRQKCRLLSAEATVAPLLVTLSSLGGECRLCVLHNAYSYSLTELLESDLRLRYSDRQAFCLLNSLLQLCQLCAAAGAVEGCCDGDEPAGWLTCEAVRVRFHENSATAMLDCLDETLHIMKSKKQQQHSFVLQSQQSATSILAPTQRLIKDATYKRSRSLDGLGDGPSAASSTVSIQPNCTEQPKERRELDNYLMLALMILSRRRLSVSSLLEDWQQVQMLTIGQQQQQPLSSAALFEKQIEILSSLLENSVQSKGASQPMVIPKPWQAIARLLCPAEFPLKPVETRWDRIDAFLSESLKTLDTL